MGPTQPRGYYVLSDFTGDKDAGREPNNSRVSIAQVMMQFKVSVSSKFQLTEQQQYLKAVRVSGTDMYNKKWACGSADWYSAVGEG